MKWTGLMVAAVVAQATWTAAQPPSTQRSDNAPAGNPQEIREGLGRDGFSGGRDGSGRDRFGRRGPLSAEDRVRAIEFAREYMPNLHALIQESTQPERSARWTRFAFERYALTQRMQRMHPDAYDATLERLRGHDELFGLIRKLTEASESERSALRRELRARVRDVVLAFLDDRARRLEELRNQLEREQRQLERDRQNVDELVQRHIRMLLGEPPGEMRLTASDEPRADRPGPTTAPADGPAPR